MATITFNVERLLPCPCTALASTPFPACPECDGEGACYQEIELAVEYGYHRACRGARDRYGVPLEPDEPASCEIESVTDANGREVELTSSEMDRLEEACEEDAADRARDAEEARAEARYEARFDR